MAVANSSFVIEVYTDTSSFKSNEAIRVSLRHKTSVFTCSNNTLQGGSVIRFRNIEVDGCLAGSAADTGKRILFNVHFISFYFINSYCEKEMESSWYEETSTCFWRLLVATRES